MLNKKILALAIFLVAVFTISTVSAVDSDAIDIVSADNSENVICIDNNQLSLDENDLCQDNLLESSSDDEVLSEYISYAQISTNTITGYAGDYITLKAVVKNDKGVAKKATVEFYFNGQTYKTTTNLYGEASVTVRCPATEVWDTSSKTTGNMLTKTTTYQKYYSCTVTAYGADYYKNTDSFYVISKKPSDVKKYKIIKKKVIRTIKIKNGVKTYKWGNYGAVTYKHKGGYGTMIEVAVVKKNVGPINFYSLYHYKKNGKWKWYKWRKVPSGYSDEFSHGKLIKCDKLKIKYTQVTYQRI